MNDLPTMSLADAAAWRPTLAGLTDDDILAWYHWMLPQLPARAVFVEAGTWRCRSLLFAAELLAAIGRDDVTLYGVDPYRYPPVDGDLEACTVSYHEALAGLVEHSSEVELRHVHLLRCRSREASRMFGPASVDLAFLDGDHSVGALVAEARAWEQVLRPGGFLAGHDHHEDFPGVRQAVQELYGDAARVWERVWWVRM